MLTMSSVHAVSVEPHLRLFIGPLPCLEESGRASPTLAPHKDTWWDNVTAAGKTFCEFLDAEIQAKFARDGEAESTKTSRTTTEPTE